MGRILRVEGKGLGEAFGGGPEEAACASGGILREGVYQLGYALMKLELQHEAVKMSRWFSGRVREFARRSMSTDSLWLMLGKTVKNC